MPLQRNLSAECPLLDDDGGAPPSCAPQDEGRLLLGRLAEGDAAAFWEVWDLHRDYLFSICLREMGGMRADAEDALSRVMIKARARLPEHAGRVQNLKAWLARLTHNFCVDIHRERRRQTRGVENIEEMADADFMSLAHRIPTPEEMVLEREQRLRLRRLIEDLPPNLCQPFVLHFFQGVPYAEIAARLNLSNDNVRKRIQQARAFLRGRLDDGAAAAAALRPSAPAAPCACDGDAGKSRARARPAAAAASAAPRWEPGEIRSEGAAARLVSVAVEFGGELSFEVFLERAPGGRRVESLEAYVRAPNGGVEKRWQRARLLYERGRWDEAAAALRAMLEGRPRALDAHLLLGDILRETGQEPAARAAYEGALNAATHEASRRHVCGLLSLCGRGYAAAAEGFRAAARLEPRNAAHWNRLGETRLLAGAHEEALRAFDESLRLRPDDVSALTRSSRALLAAGRAREAEERAERAAELDPEGVPALKWLADRYSLAGGAGGDARAERLVSAALLLAPESAEAHESLAVRHVARGEWARGLGVLGAFVERNPRSAAGWLCRARWLARTGDEEAAAESLLKAYELHPASREAAELACELLAAGGEPARLLPLVEEMLARFAECWGVWAAAGRAVLAGAGDVGRACALSAQATRLQPQLPAAWSRHGRLLLLAGRRRDGVAALERAWRLPQEGTCDDRVAAAVGLGEGYRLLGEEARARAWFERAAQVAPALGALSPQLAQYRQGQALEALGDTVGAVQSYRAALDAQLLYPERRDAQRRLRLLRERVGRAAAR
ncbi:MAG TPA: sigma-70 family RNA polymerase sigma factor [Pyrinomonadaceae bacterium]